MCGTFGCKWDNARDLWGMEISDSSPSQAWRMLRSPWSWLRALERLARWKPLLLKVSPLGWTLTFHLEDQGCLSPEESSSLLGNQTETLSHHPSHLRLLRHRDVLWQITSLSYKQRNTSTSTWPQGQLHESKPIEHAIYKVPEKSGKNKLSSTRGVVCTCLWPVGAGLLLREASACKDLLLRPSCKNWTLVVPRDILPDCCQDSFLYPRLL